LLYYSVTTRLLLTSLLNNKQGSLNPPGPAYWDKFALTLIFVIMPLQLLSSGPILQAFPKLYPWGAYQLFHPHKEKKIGLPVLFKA